MKTFITFIVYILVMMTIAFNMMINMIGVIIMCFCMGVWVYGCMGVWVYGSMGPWAHMGLGPRAHMGPFVSAFNNLRFNDAIFGLLYKRILDRIPVWTKLAVPMGTWIHKGSCTLWAHGPLL